MGFGLDLTILLIGFSSGFLMVFLGSAHNRAKRNRKPFHEALTDYGRDSVSIVKHNLTAGRHNHSKDEPASYDFDVTADQY